MIKSFITKTRWLVTIILLTMLGVPQMWGAITNNNNGTYTETSGTGSFSSNTITWSFAGGNITIVQTATGGTNPSSSYTTAGRMYRYNTIEVTASNGFKIEQVAIVCDGSYYGNSIGAGSSISSNTVGGTSNVTSSTNYSNNGTHTFTPKTAGTKTHMYIRNVNSGSTNTQLRWKSGNLKVTYSYTAPTAVAKGTITSSSFDLSITDALNTNKYDVYFSTSSTAPTATTTETVANQTTKTPTISSGVSAGQDYYVWVRSVKTISSNTWKSLWTAMTSNPLSTPSAGSTVTLSKAATTNGSFKLSSSNTGTPEINSVSTAGGSGTVYVVGTPSTGYYVSNVTQSGASAAPTITEVSENVWSVVYGSSTTGTSTITVTFSPIWALKGSFDSWGDGYLMSGTGTVSVTRTLTANTRYEFKIYNKGTAYGNTGAIVHSVSGWTFATDKDNCILYTGPAGSYTFSINTSTKAASVTYPSVDHPNANYVYIKKGAGWSDARIYNYQSGSDSKMSDWAGSPILASCEICDETYYYGAAYFNKIIFRDGGSNQSNEVSLDRGKWLDETTHADLWSTFDKYTISYDKGTGTGGSMSSHTDLCPGGEQALSTNTYTKDHYHFTGWIADRDVTINSATVTQGTLITGTPTIENIQHDIALTAQWEADSYTVTATLTNLTPNSAFPSSVTYTGSSTTALNRTLNAATGYNLPTSITVTMGGSTLTKDTHYTYNSTNGAFTFTATITGAIVITAAGVAKTYSNTLDREGAGSGSTTVTTTYNSSTLTGYTAPTKTGYIFGGYWSADNGTGTEVIGTNGALKTSVTIDAVAWTDGSGNWVKDGAVTLYAKWTPITFTVAYNKNGGGDGTGTANQSFTYDAAQNLRECGFTAPGTHKYFAGWDTNSGAANPTYTAGQSVSNLSSTQGATVTLYAIWKDHTYTNYRTSCADQYNIVLDDGLVATTNNGSAKVAANGTTLTSIVAPTKSGYDIEGYYTTSGLTTKIATDAGALQNGSGSGITVGGNAWTNSSSQWVRGAGETFYTKWTAHTYNLTYEGLEGATHSNPATYTIETSTITLTNPSARAGYTFTGWTCGGDAITQIAVGSTGDKTITANWTINKHTVAVSAADHVVITATPAGGSTIAEGSSTANINYGTTVTLNCTPDSHWNLAWDVYKTGESSTKVAVAGEGDGATFTLPDYNVTVTAVMTEATYHTATFKNNGAVIAGYDAVKTYDGVRPSAPTLTDITDACDKTDCNKFYGWIAEDGIWNKTIDNVAGKTIYRRASDIPNVSGADVVYHAVWAKGEAGPELSAPTPIIYWARQSIAASTNISATSGTGTLNSNVAFTDDAYEKVYNSGTLSSYPTITLSGLDMSGATGSTVNISFFTRGTNASAGTLTVKYTDSGNEYTAGTVTVVSKQICYHEVSGIPKTATQIKFEHGANSGNLAIGTIKIFEPLTTSYTFTELTSENTSGWANADWDGYYLITNGQVSLQALDGNGIGEKNITSVTASAGVISTTNAGAAFKVTWVSGSGYKMQGVGSGDYLNTASNSVAPSASVVYMSEIGYNSITDGSSNKLYWNSSKFGFYSSTQTSPVLYKIMESFTEFRITCCDKTVTIGTPAKTGSGTVTFASGGDAYAAGDEVETCYGATTITATVTPSNGYQCTVLSFTRSDSEDLTPDPAISVPFTGAQNYDLTFEQNADGVTLNTTVTFVALIDHYIDNMHYNTTQNKSGGYGTAPTLSDETKGEQCTGLHYKFIGWIPEEDMNMTTGVPTTTENMVAGGATGKYATGTNYYAIWAEEE